MTPDEQRWNLTRGWPLDRRFSKNRGPWNLLAFWATIGLLVAIVWFIGQPAG